MARASVQCPGDELPQFDAGLVVCSLGGSPSFVSPLGLENLTWAEVAALNGALLGVVVLAVAYQKVGSLLWGR